MGGVSSNTRIFVGTREVRRTGFSTFGGNNFGVVNLMYTIATPLGDIGENLYFGIHYYASSNGDRDFAIDQLTVDVIPEPGTAMLLALSLLAVACWGGG